MQIKCFRMESLLQNGGAFHIIGGLYCHELVKAVSLQFVKSY